MGGGGGGGGVIYNASYPISAGVYNVTVGDGGTGAPQAGSSGTTRSSSIHNTSN